MEKKAREFLAKNVATADAKVPITEDEVHAAMRTGIWNNELFFMREFGTHLLTEVLEEIEAERKQYQEISQGPTLHPETKLMAYHSAESLAGVTQRLRTKYGIEEQL